MFLHSYYADFKSLVRVSGLSLKDVSKDSIAVTRNAFILKMAYFPSN